MRKKLTRTRAKKRGRKLASALTEINTRYAGVFKELSSEHPATPEFEKKSGHKVIVRFEQALCDAGFARPRGRGEDEQYATA